MEQEDVKLEIIYYASNLIAFHKRTHTHTHMYSAHIYTAFG